MTDNVDNPFSSTPSSSGVEDLLAAIKNEAGEQKYKTVEEGIKALIASQAFIPTIIGEKKALETELEALRIKAGQAQSMEEVLRKLAAEKETLPIVSDPPAGTLSADKIAELVRKELANASASSEAQKNFETVQNSLKSKFGDKTQAEVARKAAELGTTPEKLGELSRSSPAMVMALFNAAKAPGFTPTTGSIHLPTNPNVPSLERPAKSLLLGATSREQKEFMMKVKEDVYRKHNVEV